MSRCPISPPSGGEERPGIPRIVGALAVLGAAVAFVAVLGLMGARWYMVRNIPSSELAAVQRFTQEPVHFPPEWAEVELFPEEVLQGKESIRLLWAAHSPALGAALNYRGAVRSALESVRAGAVVTDEEWTSAAATVAYGRPVLEETSRVVSLAGYDLDAAPPGWPDMATEIYIGRLACAAAHDHARRGE